MEGQFDQRYFRDWLELELEQMDTFYLLDFFKRMIRETVSPDGFSVTRIFPRIDQGRVEIYLARDYKSLVFNKQNFTKRGGKIIYVRKIFISHGFKTSTHVRMAETVTTGRQI